MLGGFVVSDENAAERAGVVAVQMVRYRIVGFDVAALPGRAVGASDVRGTAVH